MLASEAGDVILLIERAARAMNPSQEVYVEIESDLFSVTSAAGGDALILSPVSTSIDDGRVLFFADVDAELFLSTGIAIVHSPLASVDESVEMSAQGHSFTPLRLERIHQIAQSAPESSLPRHRRYRR